MKMHSSDQQDSANRKPTKLYIIGNGFDLWHDIPSGYEHFKEHVRQRDRDVFEAVENYLPAGDYWWSLELALAEVDVDSIIDDLSHFMPSYNSEDWSDSGHHDFQYEVEQVVERLSTELNILDDYFSRTFKPSEKLIQQHQVFFDELDAVDTVYVLGHSLSNVDLPYIQALLRKPKIAAARWHFACRNEAERSNRRDRLVEIGVFAKNAMADLWADYC